jgi:hypothetical protein
MSGSLRTTLRPLTIAEAAVFTAARPRGLNRTNHDESRERRALQGREEDGMAEPTLYERLGGIFAIAAVVDHFSDQLLKTRRWSRQTLS